MGDVNYYREKIRRDHGDRMDTAPGIKRGPRRGASSVVFSVERIQKAKKEAEASPEYQKALANAKDPEAFKKKWDARWQKMEY